jgi:hypothetical protein
MDNAYKHSFQWCEEVSIGIQQPSPATNRELIIVKDVWINDYTVWNKTAIDD